VFLKSLALVPGSMIIFDRGYNDYHQFAAWTEQKVYFITRLKRKSAFKIKEIKKTYDLKKDQAMVLWEEIIQLTYHPVKEDGKKDIKTDLILQLRRIGYQDEQNHHYDFLTNNFDIPAEEVAFLYKKRWGIELLFKKMKQNFQLHYFYGENENAIYTQVWCTLIAQLLLTVTQKIAQTKKAFSVVASLVRIHLISLLDVNELLRSTRRTFKGKRAPPGLQLCLNMPGVTF